MSEETVERTVKIRGYTVNETIVDPITDEERPHSRLARRGEVVTISEREAAVGDELGYFYPEVEEVEDEEVVEASVPDMSDDELDIWIAGDGDHAPTVPEVLEAAVDSESAERLLAAESRVAAAENRNVRVGLEKGLAEVIGTTAS